MKLAAVLLLAGLPLAAQVKFSQHEGTIDVAINGKPFTTLYFGKDAPKPYLHPLRTAGGTIITRKYPMEKVEGESRDHLHHRGLWFTHGDVNGIDFWANEPDSKSPKKGHVVLKKINSVKGGDKQGTIDATFDWNDPDGKTIMTEHRVMTFHADDTNRVMDFDVRFTAVGDIKWGDTKEGTFAIRLADSLSEKKGGVMTSSTGVTGMKNIWGKAFPWVDYAGTVEGEKVGIAIFDNPKNPRYPTTWHARDYGLFAANIFGTHDFLNDKTKDGGLTMKPGETIRFQYRVVIHPGDGAAAHIAEMYKKYAGQ